jgi:hypothetical protein
MLCAVEAKLCAVGFAAWFEAAVGSAAGFPEVGRAGRGGDGDGGSLH